jgi:hypothetical protein
MKRGSLVILGVFMPLLLILTGCFATLADVVKAKEEGTVKIYPVNANQAWEISKTVFRWEGADVIEEHRADGYMLTSSDIYWFSRGAVMGAWIEPADQNNTRVTVVTKRRVTINFATTLTETTFHKRFAQAVEIVKAGNSLPIAPPN